MQLRGAVIDYKLKKGFIRLQYNYNRFNRKFLDDSTDIGGYSNYQNGKYNGTSNFAEIYTSLSLTNHLELLTGIDYRQNSSSQLYIYLPDYGFPSLPISADSAKTNQFSYYASLMFKKEKGFNVELGGRYNHHNIYGSNFTYSANPFFIINKHFKIYADISSGYNVPSIYQLYSEYGNRNLKPEVTNSFEAGVQLSSEKASARISGFARRGKDVFYFFTDPATYAEKYINADKQKDYGIETQASYRFSPKFSASFNYTFTDGKIVTSNGNKKDTSYFNLYKRPKNVLNIFLNYEPTKQVFLSANFKSASKAFEPQYMGPDYELKGYYTIGFYGEYKINKSFKIFTDFKNITDQQYFVTRGFTTKGFNFNGGIKAAF